MDLFAPYAPDEHGAPLTDVTVRPATVDDLTGCAELLVLREGGDAAEWTRRLAFWAESGHQIYVALLDGRVIGYARLALLRPSQTGGRGVPDGWYLSGLIVHPAHRRRGVGRALTLARCRWAWEQGEPVHFVVNSINGASIDLHRELGFREVTRDFSMPGVTFSGGGEGVLFVGEGSGQRQQVSQLRVRAAG